MNRESRGSHAGQAGMAAGSRGSGKGGGVESGKDEPEGGEIGKEG